MNPMPGSDMSTHMPPAVTTVQQNLVFPTNIFFVLKSVYIF